MIVAIANKMVIDCDEWQIKDNHQQNGHHGGMIIMMIGAESDGNSRSREFP